MDGCEMELAKAVPTAASVRIHHLPTLLGQDKFLSLLPRHLFWETSFFFFSDDSLLEIVITVLSAPPSATAGYVLFHAAV